MTTWIANFSTDSGNNSGWNFSDGVGASAGIAAASGIGGATAIVVGDSSGVAVATGVSSTIALSVGDSSGVAVATGASGLVLPVIGSASGVGEALAVSNVLLASVAVSLGAGNAIGISGATANSVGDAAGVGTADGAAVIVFSGVGETAGTGAVNGVAGLVSVAEGAVNGAASITGLSGATSSSVGAATGVATATGIAFITNVDFYAWLKDDNKSRVILVEATDYHGAAEHVNYMSNVIYVSSPTASPANIAYDDIVRNVPSFSTKMAEQFTGQSIPAWGDIDIVNENGNLDAWLTYAWDGREINLLLGDATWERDDFRYILTGTIASIYAKDNTTISLKIRDKQWKLNVPVQTSLIGGTTSNKDLPIPLCYGECFNIEPVLIVSATHQYQVHDGAVEEITTVYDNGLSVAFTPTIADGTFVLNAAPAGRITADVKGAKPGGVYLTKCADIMSNIITAHSTLTSADLDADIFTAFNTTAPQTLGLYVRDRANMLNVLDSLVLSVGSWYGFSRAGLLQLGQLIAPAGTPVTTLDVDDVVENTLQVKRIDIPITTERLLYKKNWTIMNDGVAGAATEARRAELATAGLISKALDASIKTVHKLALEPDVEDSLLVASADADTEAARRLNLHGITRSLYSFDGFSAPFSINLGDVISLDHPRFGFNGGALAIVVGITEQPTQNRISLDLWK